MSHSTKPGRQEISPLGSGIRRLGLGPKLGGQALQLGGNFQTANGSAKVPSLLLQYMLDITTLKAPSGIELIRTSKGWHRYFYNYMQNGSLRGLLHRGLKILRAKLEDMEGRQGDS